MEKQFIQEEHFFLKAVEKAAISFPISREAAVKKADVICVKTDFDQCTPLQEILAKLGPNEIENYTQLRQAYLSASAAELKEKLGY